VAEVINDLVIGVGVNRCHQTLRMPNLSCSTLAMGAKQFVVQLRWTRSVFPVNS